MNVRAKFRLDSITHHQGSTWAFKFIAVHDMEASKLFRFSSVSGEFTMTVNNPAVFEAFEIGKEYYADFSPAR